MRLDALSHPPYQVRKASTTISSATTVRISAMMSSARLVFEIFGFMFVTFHVEITRP